MADKRIFIAFDISDEARASAIEHIDSLRKDADNVRVSWEKPEKLHVTVKFLGEVDDRQLADITSTLSVVASKHSPITAGLSQPGVFPNSRRPRILWLGIDEPTGEIATVAEELDDALEKLGFRSEVRGFKPHLTIARVREPEKGSRLAQVHLERATRSIVFSINELSFYESKLRSTGSTYSVLSRHGFTS